MMKFLSLALTVFITCSMSAQIQTPAASPAASLTQTVGLTKISIDYSRPSRRGRKIFGGILPYGTIWRTGANSTTKFSIDKAITLGGKELKAGTYSLYTIPGENEWEVIFTPMTATRCSQNLKILKSR